MPSYGNRRPRVVSRRLLRPDNYGNGQGGQNEGSPYDGRSPRAALGAEGSPSDSCFYLHSSEDEPTSEAHSRNALSDHDGGLQDRLATLPRQIGRGELSVSRHAPYGGNEDPSHRQHEDRPEDARP